MMTPSEVRERDAQRLLAILSASEKEEEFDLEKAAQLLLNSVQNGENSSKKLDFHAKYRQKVEKRQQRRQNMTKLQQMVNSVEFHTTPAQGGPALNKHDRYLAMAEMRKLGRSWDEIAQLFEYKSAKTAIEGYRAWAKKYAVEETVAEVRRTHDARLEEMYSALRPGIEACDGRTPRAVEVAIKVLERQARLHGADAVEEAATQKGGTQQQAVVISIAAHPGDQLAQQLVIEGGSSEVGGGQGTGQILSSSNSSLPEPEEDNLLGGRDLLRENLVRPLLDSPTPREATE